MAKPIVRMVDDANTDDQATDEEAVLLLCGWEQYDMESRTCCGGDDWCDLMAADFPVAKGENLYNKAVLGTMNLVARANRGVAILLLRLVYWRKVRVAHVVVNRQRMTMVVRPCQNAKE